MICVAAPQWARVVLQGEYLFITIKKKTKQKDHFKHKYTFKILLQHRDMQDQCTPRPGVGTFL